MIEVLSSTMVLFFHKHLCVLGSGIGCFGSKYLVHSSFAPLKKPSPAPLNLEVSYDHPRP